MINCRHSHYLLGKWIECKRATPKECTQPKRLYQEDKEIVKPESNQFLFNPIPQIKSNINNFIQTNNNNTNFYFPYNTYIQENYPSYSYNYVNKKEEVKGNVNVNRNQSSLFTSSQSESEQKDELNLSNDSIYQKKPETSNTFSNYFNKHMKNPLCFKYFHYKLFDTSGEEVNELIYSHKNQSKLQLFVEDKVSSMISTNESMNWYRPEENVKNEDDNESVNNCFGPKRKRMNCFSSKGFFTPY